MDPAAAIANELSRTEESGQYAAMSQFSSGKFWRGLNLALGIPAAVTATLSGAAGLEGSTGADTVAILALVAAALAAVQTTLNASERANQSLAAGNAYLALVTDSRVLRTIDLANLSQEESRLRLDEIVERRRTINGTAPVPPFLAYKLGARNIAKGRQDNLIDKE